MTYPVKAWTPDALNPEFVETVLALQALAVPLAEVGLTRVVDGGIQYNLYPAVRLVPGRLQKKSPPGDFWILQVVPNLTHQPDHLFHPLFQRWEVDEFMHGVCPTSGRQADGHGWDAAAERQVGIG